ncbi:IS3 family transposase [Clostridium facile]|uniref:IS3 family transposase n=1 Tax=Clostridium facile TaxID=2763035 RepID=A0ABR7IQG3_9CLOT|nr:IS3 family transposase [Clostridium facile]
MAENFFSILKTECIYWHKPATFSEPNDMIDRYIIFTNTSASRSKQYAHAALFLLKLNISALEVFLYCLHNMGQ